jgi:hypothetical protein
MSPFDQVIIHEVERVIVEVGIAGPPGPPGPPGSGNGSGSTALDAAACLAEFDTDAAKSQARANLGLADIYAFIAAHG